MKFTDFELGYIDCMFFTCSGDEQDELTSDHTIDDLAPETVTRIKSDCDKFIELAGVLLDSAGEDIQNGVDFWFTRNGHGCGFWDRDYPAYVGTKLSEHSRTIGEIWVTAGDDGLIYMNQ